MASRRIAQGMLTLATAAAAAFADNLTWSPVCDQTWQSCCDGDGNTKVNNWGRSSPAPVCPALPNSLDTVTILSDCTVGASPAAAASIINQSTGDFVIGGPLSIAQQAVFDGPVFWTSGTLDRAGGAAGQFMQCNAGLSISGDTDKTLAYFGGFRLINTATATWSGAGQLTVGMIPGGCCPAVIENADGATFTVQNDSEIKSVEYGVGTFENAGTLIKSGTTGVSQWAIHMVNTGLVHVQTGELRLVRAGTIGGDWWIEPGAQVSFAGNFFVLDPSVTIQGRAVVMSSGNNVGVYVNDDVTLDDLTIADDGRLGGTGVLRIAGTLTNEGGDPSVYIDVLPAGRIETSGYAPYFGKLDVQGVVHIPNGANLGCFNQVLTVKPGGEVVIDDGGTLAQSGLGTQPVDNYGTIRKSAGSGTGTLLNAFNWYLVNQSGATIAVDGGTLTNGCRFESYGAIEIAAGATFSQETWANYYGGTTVTGDGWMRITASNNFIETGTELVIPRLQIVGVDSSQGLSGPGNLRITHALEHTGGGLNATVTTLDPGAVMDCPGPNFAYARTDYQNHATINVGSPGMNFLNCANHPDGTIDMQADTYFGFWYGQGNFANQGTFKKTGGAVDGYVDATIINTGTVQVSSGGFWADGLVQDAGLTRLENGRIWTPGGVTLHAGTLTGTGWLKANVSNVAGVIRPGNSIGTLTIESGTGPDIPGNFSQGAAGTLRIDLGGTTPGAEHDQVIVAGSAALNGTLEIATSGGFVPQVGQQFTILTRASGSGQFSSVVAVGGGQYSVAYNPNTVVITVVQSPCDGYSPCDMNCDGSVNAQDIQPFRELLFNVGTPCAPCSGDTNSDGSVNAQDIQGFVTCLLG